MNTFQQTFDFTQRADGCELWASPCSPDRWYAYYGHPDSRIFGRVEFQSEYAFRMALWNDGSLYGGHSGKYTTFLSNLFLANSKRVDKNS